MHSAVPGVSCEGADWSREFGGIEGFDGVAEEESFVGVAGFAGQVGSDFAQDAGDGNDDESFQEDRGSDKSFDKEERYGDGHGFGRAMISCVRLRGIIFDLFLELARESVERERHRCDCIGVHIEWAPAWRRLVMMRSLPILKAV